MPPALPPIPGAKYFIEFRPGNKEVALKWSARGNDDWGKILQAVRSLPTRMYNSATKKWEVPWNLETQAWLTASGWGMPDESKPVAPREDPRIKQQQLIDSTKLDPEGILIPGLRPYQVDFIKFAQLRHGRLALGDEMGCISGDMTVLASKDGKEQKISLESLYRKFRKTKEKCDWDIQCLLDDGHTIGFGEIVDVLQSGLKKCIHATFEDGSYLIATPDHKVLTDSGWVELKDTVNTYVQTDGINGNFMSKVAFIRSAGMRMTYDVKVLNYSNFVANHTIVHNCGKTVEALSWMVYANAYPALFVVNAPTKLQWQVAYRKWVGSTHCHYPDVVILNGRTPYPLAKDKCYIINWDILADWVGRYVFDNITKTNVFVADGPLTKVGFRLLVGDEIQAIGNPNSQRSVSFIEMSKIVPHVIGMSGTPAMSKPRQFWPLLSIVEPTRFGNMWRFLNRYCDPQEDDFGHKSFDGASHVEELHEQLVGCMLRRTKEEVMKDLPPKTIEAVPLEVDETALKDYKNEEDIAFSDAPWEREEDSPRARVSRLLRTAYLLKEKSMRLWILDFLLSGPKLLLFAWHRDVVDMLYDSLSKWNPAKIYGGMTDNQRQDEINKFIKERSCRVLIANIQAGGVGIDGLQDVCHYAAFCEFAYTPNMHRQAIDRLHRGGQSKPVTAYYLIAPGTIDEEAMEVIDTRAKMMDGIMDGKETSGDDLLTELLERHGKRNCQ